MKNNTTFTQQSLKHEKKISDQIIWMQSKYLKSQDKNKQLE